MPEPSGAETHSPTVIAALQARIKDLEACLGLHDNRLAAVFKLSSSMMNLLGLLMSVPNVTPEMISTRLRIATDAKVAIHRLRCALEPWDLKIEGKRSLGYWLTTETKEKIDTIVDGKPDPVPASPANA